MSAYARLLTTEIDDLVVVAKRAIHPDHRSLLHRELTRLQAAQHPNVVRLVAHTPTHGGGFATAWAGGRTLATARLEPAAAARTMAAVAGAVADLHDRGVAHGRLAPSHVIIDPQERPVLCGFGPDPEYRLVPGSDAWRVACSLDVEAMGRLILRLTGDQAELEPFPLHRFAREPRWEGMTRRALQTLADQACDPVADRRPSARSLAASLGSLASGAAPPPRSSGTGGSVALRLGASIGLAGALGVLSSQRAWSQGIRPLTSASGGDPAAASVAVLQLAAALLVLVLVLSTLAEVTGRILGSAALGTLAERAAPARLRSMWGRVAGLALGASVSLACQIRTPHPSGAGSPDTIDQADPPASRAHAQRADDRSELHGPTGPAQGEQPRADALRSTAASVLPSHDDAQREHVEILDAVSLDADPATWTVGPGDHLWAIADATLRGVAGRPAADAEVARYWQRLIVANPGVTDPDLVLPGQVIVLPAV